MPARSYIGNDHLWSTITTAAGTLAVLPTSATTLHFDAARSNHMPAMRHEGQHGSTVLDIGRGVGVRVTGHAEKVGACWELMCLLMSRDSGGDVTILQYVRAKALVFEMLNEWAQSRAGDIAQADDIARNNGALRLEERIAAHASALKTLKRELRACDAGRAYDAYPDLATDR